MSNETTNATEDRVSREREDHILDCHAEIARLQALLHRVLATERRKVRENRAEWFDDVCAALTGGERATPRDGDICASCGAPYQEHQPGGTRYGPTTLCGVFIPGGNEPN